MRFSYSTPKENSRGLKHIRELKMGKSSLEMIQDVDLALKALELVYRKNRAAVEGMADKNGHRRKLVGEGESVSWGGTRTKGKRVRDNLQTQPNINHTETSRQHQNPL